LKNILIHKQVKLTKKEKEN